MKTRLFRLLAALFALTLVAAACSDDDDDSETTTTPVPETTDTADDNTDSSDDTATDGVEAEESIAAIAAGNDDFSTLVTALDAAGLVETLDGEGEFTVFAPTNSAFEALPEGTLDTLLADPEGALSNVLTYHVLDGAVLAEDVVGLDGTEVTMLNGDTVMITVTDTGVTLTDSSGGTANVVTTDIVASNGVIHVIDAVLVPAG